MKKKNSSMNDYKELFQKHEQERQKIKDVLWLFLSSKEHLSHVYVSVLHVNIFASIRKTQSTLCVGN